jgi:hypothetical protein
MSCRRFICATGVAIFARACRMPEGDINLRLAMTYPNFRSDSRAKSGFSKNANWGDLPQTHVSLE